MADGAPPGWVWVRSSGGRFGFGLDVGSMFLLRLYRMAECRDPAPGLADGGVDWALLLPDDPARVAEMVAAVRTAHKLMLLAEQKGPRFGV